MKIKKGNSFNLICTLKANGSEIDIADVQDLSVRLVHTMTGTSDSLPFEEVDGKAFIKIPESLTTGRYRLIVKCSYLGQQVDRDPYVFEIVSHIEQESPVSDCLDVQLDSMNVSTDISGIGSQGFNGWTPAFVFVTVDGKIVMRLAGYIGGTGNAPTANINKYVGNEVYTDSIEEAFDFKGLKGDKFLFSDYTEEDIYLLQTPARDAATALDTNWTAAATEISQAIRDTNTVKEEAETSAQKALDAAASIGENYFIKW